HAGRGGDRSDAPHQRAVRPHRHPQSGEDLPDGRLARRDAFVAVCVSGRRIVASIAAAMAAAQLWLAHRYFGFLTGDEVEVLAEAFRVARGFHYRAWEIRNLFVPDFVVAPAIRIA